MGTRKRPAEVSDETVPACGFTGGRGGSDRAARQNAAAAITANSGLMCGWLFGSNP